GAASVIFRLSLDATPTAQAKRCRRPGSIDVVVAHKQLRRRERTRSPHCVAVQASGRYIILELDDWIFQRQQIRITGMTSLDVDSVKAFVAIADLKSFTRAADALGTTQGAISVKLKRLEDRLGKKLIERTPRLVRVSAQGAAFLEPARELLAAHDRAIAGLTSARR